MSTPSNRNPPFTPNKNTGISVVPGKPAESKSQFPMMMQSERGGNGGINFKYDEQSNKSGLAGTGGLGGRSNDDNNLLELMVMQNAADAIRQEYIEEPSYRKSMFNAPMEDITVTRSGDMPSRQALILMVIAFVSFGIVTITFKAIYLNYRHTIWEDVYGRGISFFFFSTISYMKQSGTQSIFDIRKTIRSLFMLRVALISIAYMFIFLAVEWASSYLYISLIICLLQPLSKLFQRYTLIVRNHSTWETLVALSAVIGMVFLFQAEAQFVNKNKYIYDLDFTYDNLSAYIYGVLAIICWSLANALLQKNRTYIHHTVDTFYVGFFTSIVVPALLLGYFSIHPTKLTYDYIQFVYFGVSGFLWWLFHTMYTRVIESDTSLHSMPAIYVYLLMTIAADGITKSKDLQWNVALAMVLIVAPNICLIIFRYFKIIRDE